MTNNYLDFTLDLLQKTRSHILKKVETGFSVDVKPDKTFVTEVDKGVERIIRDEIAQTFPKHSVVGEEYGEDQKESEFKWIIDPIDGTLNFTKGIPLYGTILSLYQNGEALVGALDFPGLNRTYYATKGGGSFCDKKKLAIKDVSPDQIPGEIISTGDIKYFADFNKLTTCHPLVRTIPDCFAHALAAQGATGACIDHELNLWDISATKLLIEESGGKFVVIKEKKSADGKIKTTFIAGKPTVVDWLTSLPLFDTDGKIG